MGDAVAVGAPAPAVIEGWEKVIEREGCCCDGADLGERWMCAWFRVATTWERGDHPTAPGSGARLSWQLSGLEDDERRYPRA